MYAVRSSNIHVIKFLLDRGCNPLLTNNLNHSAWDLANSIFPCRPEIANLIQDYTQRYQSK